MGERVACKYPSWYEDGDGHGHNHWVCATCGVTRWIAPWVLNPPTPPPVSHGANEVGE